jgi:RimJ/RimL family protein N-acetyltransferase
MNRADIEGSNAMKIRILGPDDAASFQELRLQGLQTDPVAFGSSFTEEEHRSIQEIAQRLSAADSYVFGAFTDTGQLIGMTGLVREKHTKSHHKAIIWGMVVDPEFRGQGIGRSLLRAALSHASDLPGLRQVNLSVVTTNQAAYALYLSCGFEVFGLEQDSVEVDGEYYDVAHMRLRIDHGPYGTKEA